MRYWSYCISADPQCPDMAMGFLQADTAQQALQQIGHPDANVYPLPENFRPKTATSSEAPLEK